ncbi:MAG TPA: BTAD domain-containing putative transcriptional regulator, partial [Acidimicrobiales bacterium]|nr:BTAD domain-containing putative transcriptional regulator [Acidimicrobiales bacterium]
MSEGRNLLARGQAAVAIEVLGDALAAWRGPAYADFVDRSWAMAEAARLEELRLQAVEVRMDAHAAIGANVEVIALAEPVLTEHPLRESTWARLITALYRDGRQSDARQAFGRLRGNLTKELGLEPSAEVQALGRAVWGHDPAGFRPAPLVVSRSPSLPTGVVTFLLTDIAGSTKLWERDAAAMADALEMHDKAVGAAVSSRGGTLLKARGEGDSTFSVFHRASHGAAAALAAQAALEETKWPEGCRIRVRMALHSGEAIEREGDYYGPAVNRAARLRSLAERDQILVSASAAQQLADDVPAGSHLIELGRPWLPDLERPETVYLLSSGRPGSPELADEPSRQLSDRLRLHPGSGVVGRSSQRATFAARLSDARDGRRQIVLLAGEPGIGKTSLMSVIAEDARQAGMAVLYGRCDEGLGAPYQPWMEALGELVAGSPERVLDEMGPRRLAHLARLVPTVADRRRIVPQTIPADDESERYLAFGAALALLEATSSRRPLLLVLDDLHWADAGTLLLLRFVAGAADPLRLIVVGTFRDTEIDGTPGLADALSALRRERSVEGIRLGGLNADDLAEFVAMVAGDASAEHATTLGDLLRKETGGNPFFAGEILRHLVETGGLARTALSEDVPESVRDVLLRRVARLGRSAEKVLTAAAVIGPDFDVNLLVEVSGTDDEDVLDVLELAERASIVAPVDTYRYGFRHALIRSALYSEASRARLGRLHRAVAESIEAGAAREPPEADLAHHWGLALPPAPGKALQWALAAGAAALAALAPFDALGWYSRALNLLTSDHDDDPIRTETLIGLGQAQRRCGDPHYRASLLEAAGLAEHQGDAARMARAVLALQRGFGSTSRGVDSAHIDLAEKALRLVGTADLRTRAGLLADLGVELTGGPDFERRKAASDEALATARALGDLGILLRVLNLRYMTIY